MTLLSFLGKPFSSFPQYFIFLVGFLSQVFDIFLHVLGAVGQCLVGSSKLFDSVFLSSLQKAEYVMGYALPRGT